MLLQEDSVSAQTTTAGTAASILFFLLVLTRKSFLCCTTRCLRKYCNCLAIGVRCTSSCQCSDCENGPPSTNPSNRGYGSYGAKNGRVLALSRTGCPSQPTLTVSLSSQSARAVPFSPILARVNAVVPLQEEISSPTETTTEYVTAFCSI
jgi:hypothetical protein